jgi:hypothetical protein
LLKFILKGTTINGLTKGALLRKEGFNEKMGINNCKRRAVERGKIFIQKRETKRPRERDSVTARTSSSTFGYRCHISFLKALFLSF